MSGFFDTLVVGIEFEPGTWTNVTEYLEYAQQPITTNRGRSNAYEAASTGSLSLLLDNPDGRFTPNSAKLTTGDNNPYFPNVLENKRIEVFAVHGATWDALTTWGSLDEWFTTGATTYPIFLGYINSWTSIFPEGESAWSQVAIDASDRFKFFARRLFLSTDYELARFVGASAYYPLNQPEDSGTEVTDQLRTDGTAKIILNQNNSDGRYDWMPTSHPPFLGGSLDFSGSSGPGKGDGSGVIRILPVVDQTQSVYTFSVAMWFRTSDTSNFPVLFAGGRSLLSVYSGGVLRATFCSTGAVTSSEVVTDNTWHHVVVVYAATGTSFDVTMYLDGVLVGSDTELSSLGQVLPWWIINGDTGAMLDEDDTILYHPKKAIYSGDVRYAGIILAATDLSGDAGDLYAAGKYNLAGETAEDRSIRYLQWAGLVADEYDVATDTTAIIGGHDTDGLSALDALQAVADAEGAPFFIAPDGLATQQSRDARYQYAPTWTFDGLLDLDGGSLSLTLSDEGVVNRVTATAADGTSVVVYISDALSDVMSDSMSGAQLSPVSDNIEAPWADADQARDAAYQRLIDRYQARLRMSPLVVDPLTSSDDIWADVLSVELSDVIRVTSLNPATTGGSSYRDFIVESVNWSIGHDEIKLTMDTTAKDPASGWLRFDDDTVGRFGHVAGSVLVTTAGCLSGTGTGTFAASTDELWTTDSADFPLTVKLDAEEMTVSGIAGTSSPQTFTVSERGANGTTADTHSVGAAVELWPVPIYAY